MPAETFPKRLAIGQRHFEQIRNLLAAILPANPFYTAKADAVGVPRRIVRLSDFTEHFPFTTKAEIVADQASNPPYGTNLTYPLERFTRCHQTSGTSGQPLRWLDTPESWDWMVAAWEKVLTVAGVRRGDRVYFAFSFGPFIGFWMAFEAALRAGCLAMPGGGLSSVARLKAILEQGVTILCCTPTYAIHLTETALAVGIDLKASAVRTIIVAGEPGGSLPSVRARVEALWPGARLFDHHGMTEIGPVSFECPAQPGILHVMEHAYFPEIIDPATGKPSEEGHVGELILTNLGRTGSPLLRYRTGDLVRASLDAVCPCGRSELALEGGILGRLDDMTVVRGVNIYPAALEEILRQVGGWSEYRVTLDATRALPELSVEVEAAPDCVDPERLPERIEHSLQGALSLRVPVTRVAAGTLPRFEMKSRRWLRKP